MSDMDDSMEFREWLEEIGLETYAEVLAENEIDFDVIIDCTDADFKELGLPLGARKRLLNAVTELEVSYEDEEGDAYEVEYMYEKEPEPTPPPAAAVAPAPPLQPAPPAAPTPAPVPVHQPVAPTPAHVVPPAPIAAPHAATATVTAAATPNSKTISKGKRSRKATAIIVAVVVHLLLLLIATLLVILPPSKDEAEIIATLVSPNPSVNQEMKKKTVQKQVKRNPAAASAAAAPMAMMMKANAVARFTAPDVKKTSTGPLGMGEGDLGKGAFGAGTGLEGSGAGGGAAFFGSSSTGNRFLFVLDHSASMKTHQISLRNAELEKALKSLSGAQYQVLLFAGAALYAEKGWQVRNPNLIEGPGNKEYAFTNKGAADYTFKGKTADLPRAKWLSATPSNIKKTMEFVESIKKFYGTDWGMALEIGHAIEPKPDVIFFMADGTGGNNPEPILEINSKNGRPVINTVAMQTKSGAEQFAEVAKSTRGKYTIVDKDGKPIDGFDYIKNPGKYKGRL